MISIFKNINKFVGKSEMLDALGVFCAIYLMPFMVFYLFLFAFNLNKLEVFFYPVTAGLFGAFVINKIIYVFYKEKRPAELESTKTLILVPKNPSFPSRHASLVFGISFCLFFYDIPLAITFLICSCFVGVGRVFCGVHWFRDIVAGVFVGFISALTIYNLLNYILQ